MSDDYRNMQRGIRPEGCTCVLLSDMMLGPDAAPAEWQPTDDCPLHGAEPQFELLMPFTITQSAGGPYDDEAFVAGFELGRLDACCALIAGGHLDGVKEHPVTMRAPLRQQADLIAMRHGGSLVVESEHYGPTDAGGESLEWVIGKVVWPETDPFAPISAPREEGKQ